MFSSHSLVLILPSLTIPEKAPEDAVSAVRCEGLDRLRGDEKKGQLSLPHFRLFKTPVFQPAASFASISRSASSQSRTESLRKLDCSARK